MEKLELCPFCGSEAKYWKYIVYTNFDHTERSPYKDIDAHAAETVECSNMGCPVRPKVERIGTDDAIDIWNTRKGE